MRIGIDLGGTKTEGVVMDGGGAVLFRERRPTPRALGYEAILENISDLVNALERRAGRTCRVGIGTPGSLSTRSGSLKNSNTVCMNGRPLKTDLEQRLAREVRMENDANCFALAEALDGAGRGAECVFGVIMGTGVGGGIVFRRSLHTGHQHIAGEWGHNVLEADGPPCYCGRQGCVETFLSGPGLLREWRHRVREPVTGVEEIVARARANQPAAVETMERFTDRFGRALSVVVNILDPDFVVLGGGLSNIDMLYDRGRESLARHVFNDECRTRLVRNEHGDSAGVRGAAQLWPA